MNYMIVVAWARGDDGEAKHIMWVLLLLGGGIDCALVKEVSV